MPGLNQISLDDDELFFRNGYPTKDVEPYLQPEPMMQAGFGPALNLNSDFVERSCGVVITTTLRRQRLDRS